MAIKEINKVKDNYNLSFTASVPIFAVTTSIKNKNYQTKTKKQLFTISNFSNLKRATNQEAFALMRNFKV
jgi:hypothetical protein